MSDRTSPRRINHKEKDPLAHLREDDTVPKRKAFKPGRRRFDDEEDEDYD